MKVFSYVILISVVKFGVEKVRKQEGGQGLRGSGETLGNPEVL
jgi:hypothetical protein